VTHNGHLHLLGDVIDPAAVDPDDAELLGDLVVAAWQDAHDQVAQLQAAADPLGGLGGLGGLLGGA
jgi:DNA-binding protein YbaB